MAKCRSPKPEFSVRIWTCLPNFLQSPLAKKDVISSNLTLDFGFGIADFGLLLILKPQSQIPKQLDFSLEGKPVDFGFRIWDFGFISFEKIPVLDKQIRNPKSPIRNPYGDVAQSEFSAAPCEGAGWGFESSRSHHFFAAS